MEKKAKIIATLGPSILSENKLKKLINLGVDAFRINFSHNTKNIKKVILNIRRLENKKKKKISLIADLQGVKLRIGQIFNSYIKIKYNQKIVFKNQNSIEETSINLPHSKIFRKIKKGNQILIDDGKYKFKVISSNSNSIKAICKSNNCIIKSFKSIHIPNIELSLNKLTNKDKKDIKIANKLGCNWIALSYIQNEKLIQDARKIINKDIGIISKIENKYALKNIKKIIEASDAIMIARGD